MKKLSLMDIDSSFVTAIVSEQSSNLRCEKSNEMIWHFDLSHKRICGCFLLLCYSIMPRSTAYNSPRRFCSASSAALAAASSLPVSTGAPFAGGALALAGGGYALAPLPAGAASA